MNNVDILITGIGIASSLGLNIHDFSKNVFQGRSGIIDKEYHWFGKSTRFLCAPVTEDKNLVLADKAYFLGKLASEAALNSAKIFSSPRRVGLFVGTATGSIPFYEKDYNLSNSNKRCKYLYHGVAQELAKCFKIFGKVLTINSACASSNIAISIAANWIRNGSLDAALVVGTESLSQYDLLGFKSLGILSSTNIRPFDARRDGIVLGEGAGAILLESSSSIKKRNVNILAKLVGYGISNEAYKLATPDPEGKGASLAMEKALKDANLKYEAIDYINAHGTGTLLNDEMETVAIKNVFKKKAYEIPISSSKSMLGHTRGASGSIEAVICILSILNNMIPPTINYEVADPKCDLDYVPNNSRKATINYIMSNSFGFGGHCSSIIFSKY